MSSFPTTIPELLDQLVRDRGDQVFLPRRTAQDHTPISFGRLAHDVDALATALLDLGLRRGDHVGLVAENRYEWLLIDMALASIGVVDVPRGSDTTPTELQFILEHSEVLCKKIPASQLIKRVLHGFSKDKLTSVMY